MSVYSQPSCPLGWHFCQFLPTLTAPPPPTVPLMFLWCELDKWFFSRLVLIGLKDVTEFTSLLRWSHVLWHLELHSIWTALQCAGSPVRATEWSSGPHPMRPSDIRLRGLSSAQTSPERG